MRELQNNALPQSPQENFCLVAHPLSTRFFFLTGGDGSFPGTKTTFMLGVFFLTITTRNKENIWSYSKPKETYCLRRPSHWKSFLIKATAVVVYANYSTTEPTYLINAILEKYAYIWLWLCFCWLMFCRSSNIRTDCEGILYLYFLY